MTIRRPLVWTSIVAAATALPISMSSAGEVDFGAISKSALSPQGSGVILIAASGQGGEGGEAGVVAANLGSDPVAYLTALDIIRGHELAGRDIYAAGDKPAAIELFEHAISETYDLLAPAMTKLGVPDIRAALEATVQKAKTGATPEELAKAVGLATAALDSAGNGKPKSAQSDPQIDATVVTGMLKRVVSNFEVVASKQDGEAYIDGFGFLAAAKARSERLRPVLTRADATGMKKLDDALAALTDIFPGAKMPEHNAVKPGPILAKVSKAMFMLSDLH